MRLERDQKDVIRNEKVVCQILSLILNRNLSNLTNKLSTTTTTVTTVTTLT